MLSRSGSFHLWRRQVFLRNRHKEFDSLLFTPGNSSGIYIIGYSKEIVYVGQSWDLSRRSIESLGIIYQRVVNPLLSWSIGFAPCPPEEMDERESTAIRSYAPKFNTSIPSIAISQSRMPNVVRVAAVFQDQDGPCGAFDLENLKRQMESAEANLNPPWKTKRRRRKTPKNILKISDIPTSLERTEEDAKELLEAFSVPLNEPLRFKINLCVDGSVITKDGEYIGTWEMDENAHPSFIPDGRSKPLFSDVFVGLLCEKIRKWHETNMGEAISE